jgi:predicted DNA-binding antitoxin AbrB/MazE fold protein
MDGGGEREGCMTVIDAIYENGVFRPLAPVSFKEKERVELHIEPTRQEDAKAWMERVSRYREELKAKYGVMPDSTLDIAEDRRR